MNLSKPLQYYRGNWGLDLQQTAIIPGGIFSALFTVTGIFLCGCLVHRLTHPLRLQYKSHLMMAEQVQKPELSTQTPKSSMFSICVNSLQKHQNVYQYDLGGTKSKRLQKQAPNDCSTVNKTWFYLSDLLYSRTVANFKQPSINCSIKNKTKPNPH